MIREIVEFTKQIQASIDNSDVKLEPGFHAVIELDESGNIKQNGYFSYIHRDKEEIDIKFSSQLKKLAQIEKVSEALGGNKGIIDKKIFSNNYYTLFFKLFFSSDKDSKVKLKASFNQFKGSLEQVKITDFKDIKAVIEEIFPENIKDSKIKIEKYFESITNFYPDTVPNNLQHIKNFCLRQLKDVLLKDENFYRNLILKSKSKDLLLDTELLDREVRISFSLDYSLVLKSSEFYFNKRLPLVDTYDKKNSEGINYSLPNFFTTYNDKKQFLKHQTATFLINNRFPLDDLKLLFSFETLLNDKQFPNPLPIFIDQKELNTEVVTLFKKNGDSNKLKYSEIIRTIYEDHKKDLGNYYLLYFLGGELKDFDFVSLFNYNLNLEILNLFSLYDKSGTIQKTLKIQTIFEFEKNIISRILNNNLVSIKSKSENSKEEISLKYFEDIKKEYCDGDIIYQLVLKYRKAIYDFIYKSKTQAFTGIMFYDIMLSGILNDIKKDEYKDKKHTRDYKIKEKLNIWFSLNHHFDKNNQTLGGNNMPSKLKEHIDKIKKISEENDHLKTDDEFAFASGQVIFHLLNQSESSNRTHALLEPFLQKHEPVLFKMAIATTFEKYKHNFTLYPKKYSFDKLMSEVMDFEVEEKNLKNLLPFILAGYFAESVFKKESK